MALVLPFHIVPAIPLTNAVDYPYDSLLLHTTVAQAVAFPPSHTIRSAHFNILPASSLFTLQFHHLLQRPPFLNHRATEIH